MSVAVVLPCLDEAEALPGVLSALPPGFRAIVVDNGSTDASAAVARAHGATVVVEPVRGFGAAVHAGVVAAEADLIAVLDADGSLDPGDLPRLAQPVLRGDADLVLGRRRPVGRSAWPLHLRLANRVLARTIRRSSGVVVHDLGPMRVARRVDLLALDLQDRRSGYPLEMLVKAARAGWRVVEIDVAYRPRVGRSKVTGTIRGLVVAVMDMRRILRENGVNPARGRSAPNQ
jgi:glycosyltransferase involved in cell wall biosynthesis